jgi:hypothetical protein
MDHSIVGLKAATTKFSLLATDSTIDHVSGTRVDITTLGDRRDDTKTVSPLATVVAT